MISRSIWLTALLGGVLLAAAEKPADLEALRAEPKLEKRAQLALRFAHDAVDRMTEAYVSGNAVKGQAIIEELQGAVELAYESLMATGKNPRRKPKHFKRAEIETRKLLNELRDAEGDLVFDELGPLRELQASISEINDRLLMAIMTKKKK